MTESLVCPSCATSHTLDERFCPDCGMPLVYAGSQGVEAAITDRHERARKQAEAEFIQGLLLEEGVPSLLKRSAGFDVPDYLAAGPRDVMVPASGASTARDVLLQADMLAVGGEGAGVSPARLLLGLLAACALVAIIAWLGTDLLS